MYSKRFNSIRIDSVEFELIPNLSKDNDSHQKWNYHGTSLKLMDYPNLCMDATKIGQFKLAKCSNSDNQQILFEMLHI